MPSPLFVLLRGGAYLTIYDAISKMDEDIFSFPGTTYRDTLDASFMGRSPPSVLNVEITTFTTGTSPSSYGAGDFNVTTGDSSPATVTPVLEEVILMMQESDEYTHADPRALQTTRTMTKWLTTGSFVVGWAWTDRIIGVSDRIPTYLGSAPPAYP